jgi:predicted double-glycine peptidase
MLIRVDPSILRQNSNSISGIGGNISNAGQTASGISQGAPGYDGQFGPRVQAIGNEALARAQGLLGRMNDLSGWLQSKAQAFDAADMAGVAGLGYVFSGIKTFPARLGLTDTTKDQLNRYLKLGMFFGRPRWWPSWIGWPGKITRSPIKLPESSSLESTIPQPRNYFGEINEKAKAEAEQWWLDVTTQDQRNQGLNINGQTTEFGCTPTSTSMILDYWHNKDSANQTLSAQAIIDKHAEKAEFNENSGMSATNIVDDVKDLGYANSNPYTDSTPEKLKEAVLKGPVIAIVKLNLKSTGLNHAIVVTGISTDDQVRINDPWTGESSTISWDDFSKSWGAEFGTDKNGNKYPTNSYVEIRP